MQISTQVAKLKRHEGNQSHLKIDNPREFLSPLESLFPYILVFQMKLCALLFYYHKNHFSHVHTNREYKGHACATTHLISAIKLYVVKHELKYGYLHIFRVFNCFSHQLACLGFHGIHPCNSPYTMVIWPKRCFIRMFKLKKIPILCLAFIK